MRAIPNTMIRASAGSGKTFQLTNRFIRLLLNGQAPERIIALTFTRKAAGEFFEGILTKLARAASDPEEAKRLASGIGQAEGDFGPDDFRSALRDLVKKMNRLSLGTIDSFFHRVLGMFSPEYGLGGEFEMMSEFQRKHVRLSVLETLFTRSRGNRGGQESLIESHRLATAGQERRDFVNSFTEHLNRCHELLLRVPEANRWGSPERIWPSGNPWVKQKQDLAETVNEWREMIDGAGFSGKLCNAWEKIADHLAGWVPGLSLKPASSVVFDRAISGLDEMENGDWELPFDRKVYYPKKTFCRKLARILRHCVAWELETRLTRTRGIHSLLSAYEEVYDAQVRRAGRLTFSDLPMLLAPREGQAVLGGVGPNQLDIEYRLDGAFDHWLLDEFQDTSTVQWRVMENLIDEVIQDPEGQQTFFCVGDPKQSIYQWRGGDPTLFERIEARYQAAASGEFDTVPLHISWRSCGAVLDLVNAVFGSPTVLQQFDENQTAADRWAATWEKHQPARSRSGEDGHAMYITVEAREERWALIAHLLDRIQPISNGLNCAIIVQKNNTVREVVDFLRGALPDVPVVGESATNPGADNPLGMALLSLFRAAAHPRERFSWGHVSLTPLAKLVPSDPDERQAALRRVQRDVYRRGFEPVVFDWLDLIDKSNMDPFAQWRAKQFLDLARQFDETGSRDIDEFVQFVTAQETTDASGANVVQVMTIHKAKGLTFDATIVPDVEGFRLDEVPRDTLHTHKSGDGDADWILSLPSKEICEADDQLGSALSEARSDRCYENFCRLYVALTRASHGLYVVSTERKPTGRSSNYIRLLNETLAEGDSKPLVGAPVSAGIVFERGDFGWTEARRAEAAKPTVERELVQAGRVHVRLARRRASDHGAIVLSGTQLFEAGGSDAISFGLAVHKVFEQVEWADDTTPARLESFRERIPEAVAEVERCLADETLVKRLVQPEGDVQLWRESAFDVVTDNEMISGVFDRVHLFADRAEIIDFKSDRVGDQASMKKAVERYTPQMTTYRQALAKLTGIAEQKISIGLIFTHTARVVEL